MNARASQVGALHPDPVGNRAERTADRAANPATRRSLLVGSLLTLVALGLTAALAIAISVLIFGSDGGLA